MRNRRRAFIGGSAIAVGLAAQIFVDALMIGMRRHMIHTATSSYLGDGQIHAAGYRQRQEVERSIIDFEQVAARLRRDPRIRHFSARIISMGMLSSPADLNAIILAGISPEDERHLSEIDDAMVEGSYFVGASPQDIVIGTGLAKKLEVEVGDRVVGSVAQAGSGELAQELFRVAGVFHFNTREMDEGIAFIRLGTARKMLGPGVAAHEIALALHDPAIAQDAEHALWQDYSGGGNEALGWPRLLPQMAAAFKLIKLQLAIIAGILFSVVSLGIVNTLFMSIYERTFEFGVLRALGARPRRVWNLIVCEAGALAIVSIGPGILLALLVIGILSRTGIDYRGIEMIGVTMRELIYPAAQLRQFIIYPLAVFAFTVVVGTYPAFFAARLTPANAIRKSM